MISLLATVVLDESLILPDAASVVLGASDDRVALVVEST